MPATPRPRPRRHAARSRFLEQLEDRALLSSIPTGTVDVFSRSAISGWATNADDGQGAVQIEITLNGEKTTLLADDQRDALISKLGSPYHAFSFSPPANLPPGSSTITIDAVSLSTGARKRLRTGTLTNPAPTGSVKFTPTQITGWAYDPDASGPLTLRLDIDGQAGTPFTANISRPDIQKSKKTNTDMLGFDLSGNYAGHVIELYGIDAPTNTPKLLYTNNRKALGKVEVNDGYTVSGYALDPDNPSAPINIRITIDGIELTTTTAGADRPDLVTKYGSANHGFSVSIPGLTPGKHTIAVYALDGQATSQAPVLIGSKTVTNAPPIGKVEIANDTTLSGWAFDPDLKASPVTVKVYIDQQSFGTLTADGARPDLTKKYGSPNHGFSMDLSSLSTASHAITVTVTDNRTSDQPEVVIYDDFLNNHAPTGSFDTITGSIITGWAFDLDAPGEAAAVDVYVDGKYVTTFDADQPRTDVDNLLPTPNHAFSHELPPLSFGKHKIDLYAAESQGNASVLIGSKTITNLRPVGAVESSNTSTITGWAADYDRPGEAAEIRVFINGELTISTATSLARPDIAAQGTLATVPSFSNYGFSITLPDLNAGRNQIDIFVLDSNNQLLTPLGSVVLTV